MNWYKTWGKRAFDILFSLAGLLICLPLFIIVAICIWLESGGPVFFMQERMGKGAKLFRILKFRTMRANCGKERLQFEPGALSRITAFGAVLRKTKFDEVPQLINVLIGEMSFVGPRPEVEKYRSFYTGEYSRINSARPGITNEASLKYRNEETLLASLPDPVSYYETVILPDKLRINLNYITKGVSAGNDIAIILATVIDVVRK